MRYVARHPLAAFQTWRAQFAHPWKPANADNGVRRRSYDSYGHYTEHQKRKLAVGHRAGYAAVDRRYQAVLAARLADLGVVDRRGLSVLCLGARPGGEVRAFRDLGCFALGIDLNPGPDNHYVVVGDFHNLDFPDASVDLIFSNALDHAFDLAPVIREVDRVLKQGGRVLLELSSGTAEGGQPSDYESIAWARVDDVVEVWTRHGWLCRAARPISDPWPGRLVWMERR